MHVQSCDLTMVIMWLDHGDHVTWPWSCDLTMVIMWLDHGDHVTTAVFVCNVVTTLCDNCSYPSRLFLCTLGYHIATLAPKSVWFFWWAWRGGYCVVALNVVDQLSNPVCWWPCVCHLAEFVSLPYAEFLRRKDLTPNLIQYIVHCIAMVNEQVPTLEVSTQWYMVVLTLCGL